jgi:hypothetical protein
MEENAKAAWNQNDRERRSENKDGITKVKMQEETLDNNRIRNEWFIYDCVPTFVQTIKTHSKHFPILNESFFSHCPEIIPSNNSLPQTLTEIRKH